MNEHPIERLMMAAMNSIKTMVDVDTIIGESIVTPNNVMIVPISKVSFGFAAGGSEFNSETVNEYTKKDRDEEIQYKLPFGGGSAAGVNINPVAFLIIQDETIKLMPVEYTSSLDKLLDYIPDLIDKIGKNSECETEIIIEEPIDEEVEVEKPSKTKKEKEKKHAEEKVKENIKKMETEIPVESDGEIFADE